MNTLNMEEVIKEDIKCIGEAAFSRCDGLKKIVLPEGVKIIEMLAFNGCVNLESVVIPNDLSVIGRCAFMGCKKLTNINIPLVPVDIDKDAFANTPVQDDFIQRVEENKKTLNRYSGVYEPTHSWVINGELVLFDKRDINETGEVCIPNGVKIIGSKVFHDCSSVVLF